MRSVCQVLWKQERLQVASEGGTVEIQVSQFIRQSIWSCRQRHDYCLLANNFCENLARNL